MFGSARNEVARVKRKTPESLVLRSVLDYLAASRVLAFRQQSGAIPLQSGGTSRRFVKFGTPGMADVVAFPKDRVLWIECKAANGAQSELQKAFQAQVIDHGHQYVVVRELEDLIEALEEL